MRRTEIVDMIRSILHKVAPNAQIILYGSEARGEARPDSDIDLLILVDEPQLTPEYEQEIIRPLYETGSKIGSYYQPNDYAAQIMGEPSLSDSIFAERNE